MSLQNNVNIHKIERVDESFYFDTKSIYDLVINYDGERFQCVAYSAERNKFVLQAEFTVPEQLSLKEVLHHTDIIKRDFRRVHYICNSVIQTIIPDAFYDEDHVEEIVSFNNTLAPEHLLYKNQLERLQSQLVFAIQPTEIATVRARFPEVKFTHSGAALLNYVLSLMNVGATMFVHFHQRGVEIVLMKNKSCLLYNQYELHSNEDVLTVLSQIAEQFGYHENELQVVLSGEIEIGSDREKIVKSTFSKVFFAPRDKRFAYTYRIEDDTQAHKFISLYAAYLCE